MLTDNVRGTDGIAQASLIHGHQILSTMDGNAQPLNNFDENYDSDNLADGEITLEGAQRPGCRM